MEPIKNRMQHAPVRTIDMDVLGLEQRNVEHFRRQDAARKEEQAMRDTPVIRVTETAEEQARERRAQFMKQADQRLARLRAIEQEEALARAGRILGEAARNL